MFSRYDIGQLKTTAVLAGTRQHVGKQQRSMWYARLSQQLLLMVSTTQIHSFYSIILTIFEIILIIKLRNELASQILRLVVHKNSIKKSIEQVIRQANSSE